MKLFHKEIERIKATHAKLDREFFLVMLFELGYGVLLYLLSSPMKFMEWFAAHEMSTIVWDKSKVVLDPVVLENNIALLQQFFAKAAVVFLGFFILHSVLYSLFNYLSWSHMADKRFDLGHAKGFVKISSVWVLLWMLIFVALFNVFNVATYTFVGLFTLTIVLFLHTTTMMNIVLIHSKSNNTFKKVFLKTFKMSILPKCCPPVTSGLIFVVIGALVILGLAYMLPWIALYLKEICLLYFIAFITWWRTHLYNVLKVHAQRV